MTGGLLPALFHIIQARIRGGVRAGRPVCMRHDRAIITEQARLKRMTGGSGHPRDRVRQHTRPNGLRWHGAALKISRGGVWRTA